MSPVFRFAPSPNGYLHLGHALSALLNFEAAQASGGRFLLRIEDIDATRCRAEYEDAIYEDLAWLGIRWEEPVRRQSEHFDAYRDTVGTLDRDGLIFPSFESRAEIARLVAQREAETGVAWPRDPDGAPLYPGTRTAGLQGLSARMMAEPYALRLDVRTACSRVGPLSWIEGDDVVTATPETWGDVVLARKETPTSYHLAVVIDDALQGVTHVVRGADLKAATSVHRLLQALLGLPAPVYRHHRLVLDADGSKLSKSTGATALRSLREQGATPTEIRRLIGLL